MAVEQDIKKFADAVSNSIKASTSKKAMTRLGSILIKVIQRRTRRGFGVKKELGNRTKLKKLSPKYILKRRKSQISRFTSARKSNLTFTGQMLSSLKLKTGKNKIVIKPFGTRRGGKANQAIAEFVSDKRPFLNISKVEFRQITTNFDNTIAEAIKRSLSGL